MLSCAELFLCAAISGSKGSRQRGGTYDPAPEAQA